jgi:glyoxylase-like metal-dependent hydrolase (beta-lactamase superfamily II)
MREIANGVTCVPLGMVNAYILSSGGKWILVDTGVPKQAEKIRTAAEDLFGAGTKPEYIVLTHGHFDHAGSALDLIEMWDVPIYAHRLELPYLTGRDAYPPFDPTVGGPLAFMMRFFPRNKADLSPHIHDISALEQPILGEWEVIETPGHAPGHISLWRASDKVLVAGDSWTTIDVNHWSGPLKGPEVFPTAYTASCDFEAVKRSMQVLAALEPRALACGHGVPMIGSDVSDAMKMAAAEFVPPNGRYEFQPAQTDEYGVLTLPPAPFDWKGKLLYALLAWWALGKVKEFRQARRSS